MNEKLSTSARTPPQDREIVRLFAEQIFGLSTRALALTSGIFDYSDSTPPRVWPRTWNPMTNVSDAIEVAMGVEMNFVIGRSRSGQVSVWFFNSVWGIGKPQNEVPAEDSPELYGAATSDDTARAISLALYRSITR